jgi:hypothetical protein
MSSVIDTSGMDIEVRIELKKSVQCFDWHMMFALYGVPVEAPLADWVTAHQRYADPTLIDRMFPFIRERLFSASCMVTVHASGGERLKKCRTTGSPSSTRTDEGRFRAAAQ